MGNEKRKKNEFKVREREAIKVEIEVYDKRIGGGETETKRE